jgi:hypothetical protein
LTLVLNGGEWSASCPCHFTPGLDGPQSRSGYFEVEKNNFSMLEIEPQLSSLQSIALLTELSEFLNMSS